jgi:hypothetical protein
VFFSQKRGFALKAGGSPAILAAKTWQYFLKYGCGVRFGFCCYFSSALSQYSFAIIGDFLVGYVPFLALVFLPLQFPVVVLVIFTDATYPTTSLRRLALRALSFASFSPTLSLHHMESLS